MFSLRLLVFSLILVVNNLHSVSFHHWSRTFFDCPRSISCWWFNLASWCYFFYCFYHRWSFNLHSLLGFEIPSLLWSWCSLPTIHTIISSPSVRFLFINILHLLLLSFVSVYVFLLSTTLTIVIYNRAFSRCIYTSIPRTLHVDDSGSLLLLS